MTDRRCQVCSHYNPEQKLCTVFNYERIGAAVCVDEFYVLQLERERKEREKNA
jgi:hypothetical protein